MSEQSPYEQLGVSETASFDEIQTARNRLCEAFQSDAEQIKKIETAYDAVLMDRLRMRQEGRIKVPDGIRFAERKADVAAPPSIPLSQKAPTWLQGWIDTPSRGDIGLPAVVMAGLVLLVLFVPTSVQVALILGIGATFYFLYRKERKLGRSVLLSFAGLTVGLLLGGLIYGLVGSLISPAVIGVDGFAAGVTFFLLWIVSSFLR